MANTEKLDLTFNVEVKRSGRRTYINLSDLDVKTCRIGPGDILKIRILEIRRTEEGDEGGEASE